MSAEVPQPNTDCKLFAAPAVPAFFVGSVPVYGDVMLAPMDGFSDQPFRRLCRSMGSAMSYTEFVNVDALGHRSHCGEWNKLKFLPEERPIVFQIYGHNEESLVTQALRIQDLGPDIIDLNLGCHVRNVVARGAGAALLRQPDKVARIVSRLARSLRVPVTAKIRLGWDSASRNYLQIARILEDCGAALIAVHGRTRDQALGGQADWDAIGEVKQAVRIPVLGNGDVRTPADIERLKARSGCDGVMIGRGAIGYPWIFARRDRNQVSYAEIVTVMRRHLALNVEFYGPEKGVLLFRKHAVKYIHGWPGAAALRNALCRSQTAAEFEQTLAAVTAGMADC